jgi:hypothetical protein
MIRSFKTLLYFTFAIAVGYQAKSQCTNCGIAVFKGSFYNPTLSKYVNRQTDYPNIKVWYRDSCVIEKIEGINIKSTVGLHYSGERLEKRWIVLIDYVFIYLPTHSFYRYKTFADTAKLAEQFTKPDSIQTSGVWNFYASTAKNMPDSINPMTDTTIKNINYKRKMLVYFDKDSAKTPFYFIGYFRCDKKGTMFQLEKSLSEKVGCPMVRSDGLPNPRRPRPLQLEVKYEADHLTPEEMKVFDAWEKYAKAHSVVK